MNVGHVCRVISMGVGAAAGLPRPGRYGRVIARFTRSCYVESAGGGLICVADHRLGEGPLTLSVDLPPGSTMCGLHIFAGTRLTREGAGFRLGDLLLCTRDMTRWTPPPITSLAPTVKIHRRLKGLIDRLQGYVPCQGLAALVPHAGTLAQGKLPATGPAGALEELAMARVAQLCSGVLARDARLVDGAVGGLVGLGPGLTPSGDDLLGGLMLALAITLKGRGLPGDGQLECGGDAPLARIVTALAASITVSGKNGTNRISAALLQQAVAGKGNAAQHRLLSSLLGPGRGSDVAHAALHLTRTGHTSGWDSLAGLLVGVRLGLGLRGSAAPDEPAAGEQRRVCAAVAGAQP